MSSSLDVTTNSKVEDLDDTNDFIDQSDRFLPLTIHLVQGCAQTAPFYVSPALEL